MSTSTLHAYETFIANGSQQKAAIIFAKDQDAMSQTWQRIQEGLVDRPRICGYDLTQYKINDEVAIPFLEIPQAVKGESKSSNFDAIINYQQFFDLFLGHSGEKSCCSLIHLQRISTSRPEINIRQLLMTGIGGMQTLMCSIPLSPLALIKANNPYEIPERTIHKPILR